MPYSAPLLRAHRGRVQSSTAAIFAGGKRFHLLMIRHREDAQLRCSPLRQTARSLHAPLADRSELAEETGGGGGGGGKESVLLISSTKQLSRRLCGAIVLRAVDLAFSSAIISRVKPFNTSSPADNLNNAETPA